ncbi:hypothetical protein BU14_0094s0018 [Porphyra umbilicalis]|uniref:DDE Tnp4 domain-containing protein n=1 Tax=Porphyra umbilicalis TaxID=2786 RepID=A0A1X6PDH4_PORUM|nr:hypothetical protein BU14_0094s0018 [Porphyra umbilicalis]|eukprot:OSX78941.1 hypothetical protein BU14_0094s0018 [Porphyra umbilicalis]
MACASPGSVHDSTAFSRTGLGRSLLDRGSALARSMTRDGHCIAADEAYAASELLAVPWPGGGRGDRWRDAFNFFLSSLRIHIEQAFGMLLWRWGVFWRPLRVPFSKRPSLIRACFRLHNFCRSFSSAAAAPVAPYANDRNDGSVSFARNDGVGSCQRGRRRDCERSDLRVRMTSRVEERGILRPDMFGDALGQTSGTLGLRTSSFFGNRLSRDIIPVLQNTHMNISHHKCITSHRLTTPFGAQNQKGSHSHPLTHPRDPSIPSGPESTRGAPGSLDPSVDGRGRIASWSCFSTALMSSAAAPYSCRFLRVAESDIISAHRVCFAEEAAMLAELCTRLSSAVTFESGLRLPRPVLIERVPAPNTPQSYGEATLEKAGHRDYVKLQCREKGHNHKRMIDSQEKASATYGELIGTVEHLCNNDNRNLLPTGPSVLLKTARALDPAHAAGLSPAGGDSGEEPLPVAAADDAPAIDPIGGEPLLLEVFNSDSRCHAGTNGRVAQQRLGWWFERRYVYANRRYASLRTGLSQSSQSSSPPPSSPPPSSPPPSSPPPSSPPPSSPPPSSPPPSSPPPSSPPPSSPPPSSPPPSSPPPSSPPTSSPPPLSPSPPSPRRRPPAGRRNSIFPPSVNRHAGHHHARCGHAGRGHAGRRHASRRHAGRRHAVVPPTFVPRAVVPSTGHHHIVVPPAGHRHASHRHAGHRHAGHRHAGRRHVDRRHSSRRHVDRRHAGRLSGRHRSIRHRSGRHRFKRHPTRRHRISRHRVARDRPFRDHLAHDHAAHDLLAHHRPAYDTAYLGLNHLRPSHHRPAHDHSAHCCLARHRSSHHHPARRRRAHRRPPPGRPTHRRPAYRRSAHRHLAHIHPARGRSARRGVEADGHRAGVEVGFCFLTEARECTAMEGPAWWAGGGRRWATGEIGSHKKINSSSLGE